MFLCFDRQLFWILATDNYRFRCSIFQALFTEKPVLPKVSPKKVVVPESPNFASKNLPRRAKPEAEATPEPRASLFQVKPSALHAAPFELSTDRRGAIYREQLAFKLEREAEEARRAAEFHAQPIKGNPDLMVALSEREQAVLYAKLERIARESEEATAANVVPFKAQPLPTSHRVPFQPVYDHSHHIEPEPFMQASDKRAAERKAYDEMCAAREQAAAQEKAAMEEQKRVRHALKSVSLVILCIDFDVFVVLFDLSGKRRPS
jgi:hypothetical protein